jgi:NRPS condensation-like uncharacterized protein
VSPHVNLPFEVHVHSTPTGSRLLLAINHAAFDGLGSVRLLRSIAALSSGLEDPQPAADALEARWNIEAGKSADPAVPNPRKGPIAHFTEQGHPGVDGTWIVHRRIEAVRPPQGITVNDLLLVELHLAVAEWLDDDADRVSVLMPVNVRPSAWSTDVVGNFAWLGSVDSTAAERSDRARLTEAITAQAAAIRTAPKSSKVLELIGQGAVPVAAARLAFLLGARVGKNTIATATLSNLGRVPELPPLSGAPVTELWFSAPCRAPRGLAFGVTGYDDHLHLSVRTRRTTFTLEHTQRLADRFVEVLSADRLAQAG